jgi:predicted glycoside hydrolase/deacetylase ChbG (UPF0249 family)
LIKIREKLIIILNGGLKLLEKMGFKKTDKLLIINADDYGIAQGTNQAINKLLSERAITSTSVMMPARWSNEIKNLPGKIKCENIGIHLTLTNKLKPVSKIEAVRSLVTSDGNFADNSEYIELNSDTNHVKQELKNQIELALSLGIDPTHLDSHQGSVFGLSQGRNFMEAIFELCIEYGLPFLLPKQIVNEVSFSTNLINSFKHFIKRADELSLVLIDDMICLPFNLQEGENYEVVKNIMIRKLKQIQTGITQVTIHPSFVTKELKSITPHWEKREMEYTMFLEDEIKYILAKENIKLISWKEIRDYQRSIK